MNFSLGEVLGSTWKIGWNHKVLWLYQMLPGLFSIFIFPFFFLSNPAFAMFLPEPWNQLVTKPWVMVLYKAVTFILVIPIMFAGVMAQLATTLGALKVEKGAEKLSFRELFRESLPYFWRVFGLYFIFGAGWGVIVLGFMAVNIFASVLTFGLASLCLTPLFFLLIPVVIVGYAVLELAQAAILADDIKLMDAISHGWKLFRANTLSVVVLMLILYFGFSILTSAVIFPMMFPMMLLPLGMESDGGFNNLFLVFFLVLFPIMFLIMYVVQGILMTFFQSGWAVAYMRLNQGQNTPVFIEANA